MWGVLTGLEPFVGTIYSSEIRELISQGHRPDLELLPNDIPRSQIELIEALWDADAEKRPSAGKLLKRLGMEEAETGITNERHEVLSADGSIPDASAAFAASAASAVGAGADSHQFESCPWEIQATITHAFRSPQKASGLVGKLSCMFDFREC